MGEIWKTIVSRQLSSRYMHKHMHGNTCAAAQAQRSKRCGTDAACMCLQAVEIYFRSADSDKPPQAGHQRTVSFFCGAGAAAGSHSSSPIAVFCLDRRRDVWRLLEWSSHHGHSPVAVLTRPQLWDDLDIIRTVGNLVRECPDFWRSRQLWSILRHGHLVEADPSFFASQMIAVLKSACRTTTTSCRGDGSSNSGAQNSDQASHRQHRAARRLSAAVDEFVGATSNAVLCRRLLHLLPAKDTLAAAVALVGHLPRHADRQINRQTAHSAAKQPPSREPFSTSGELPRAQAEAPPESCGSRGTSRAASQPFVSQMLTARQLAMRALVSSCGQLDLTGLLVCHAAVVRSDHMLRWLQEDEDSAQVLESVTQQLQKRAATLWALLQSHELLDSERLQLLASNALIAFRWLSSADDTSRLEAALQAAGVEFRIQSPRNQLLLDEPDDEKRQKRKSKTKASKKHKKRARELSEEIALNMQTEFIGTMKSNLTETVWGLGSDSNQLLTRDLQHLLTQMTYCRWERTGFS